MRVGIATVQVPFAPGGAAALAGRLRDALRAAGHEAEIISLPFQPDPPARICEHMLAARLMHVAESAGQPIDRLIGLTFPAYLMPHPNKRLWLVHQHRSAYERWGQPDDSLAQAPDGAHVRSVIQTADTALLPDCEALYTVSRAVSERLRRYNGIAAEPLYHPPPQAETLAPGEYGNTILVPPGSRRDLAIEALALTRQPVRLCISGDDAALRARCAALGVEGRVDWRDANTAELYGHCLAVMVLPTDDDYSDPALAAMLCAKAVLTAADCVGPAEFVIDGLTGLVAQPTPEALAEALDRLWADRARTQALGEAGRQRYRDLGADWGHVIERLLH